MLHCNTSRRPRRPEGGGTGEEASMSYLNQAQDPPPAPRAIVTVGASTRCWRRAGDRPDVNVDASRRSAGLIGDDSARPPTPDRRHPTEAGADVRPVHAADPARRPRPQRTGSTTTRPTHRHPATGRSKSPRQFHTAAGIQPETSNGAQRQLDHRRRLPPPRSGRRGRRLRPLPPGDRHQRPRLELRADQAPPATARSTTPRAA
jgi:hypothetical protein